jgi:hypothetical protein
LNGFEIGPLSPGLRICRRMSEYSLAKLASIGLNARLVAGEDSAGCLGAVDAAHDYGFEIRGEV